MSALHSLLLSSRSRSSDVVGLVQSRDEHGEESTGDEEHLMSYFAPARDVLLEIMPQQLGTGSPFRLAVSITTNRRNRKKPANAVVLVSLTRTAVMDTSLNNKKGTVS